MLMESETGSADTAPTASFQSLWQTLARGYALWKNIVIVNIRRGSAVPTAISLRVSSEHQGAACVCPRLRVSLTELGGAS